MSAVIYSLSFQCPPDDPRGGVRICLHFKHTLNDGFIPHKNLSVRLTRSTNRLAGKSCCGKKHEEYSLTFCRDLAEEAESKKQKNTAKKTIVPESSTEGQIKDIMF